MNNLDISLLCEQLKSGQRRALAKAITLVEANHSFKQQQAQQLLSLLSPNIGKSFRLGISGVPGVGKSTFIEAFGLYLLSQGYKLAVLAIDPSSSITGGAILGDKTRMELLGREENAFIRPSPSSGNLGGVAAKTREAMLLCEAAGYDFIIIETVGVGQSETTVASMVDCFCLLQLPNAGDDLQAIKKGIVEIADMILINKSDIDKNASNLAVAQWKKTLHLLKPALVGWHVPVEKVSASKQIGLQQTFQHLISFESLAKSNGEWERKRKEQDLAWMWSMVDEGLKNSFKYKPQVQSIIDSVLEKVSSGEYLPRQAAYQLLRAGGFLNE